MFTKHVLTTVGAIGLALTAGHAGAHVGYGTALYNQATNTYAPAGTNGLDPTVSSNAGWASGISNNGVNRTATVDTLADSHNNRFRFFTLTQNSLVSFTVTGTNTNGNGFLSPGVSLFSGLVPASSHDGAGDTNGLNAAAIATLNSPAVLSYLSNRPAFATWSPFYDAMDEIAANGGGAVDAGGPNWGVFKADGDFTMANNNGEVGSVTYLGSVADGSFGPGADGNADNQVSWTGYLGPGTYTLTIGGTSLTDLAALFTEVQAGTPNCTNVADPATCNGTTYSAAYNSLRAARTLHIDFNVQAVPVPAAVWLFGSAVAGVFGVRRRQRSA